MDQEPRRDQENPAQADLPFEEFRRLIAEQLQVDEAQVKQQASFVEDLRADSIQLVELMLHLEEEGMGIPLEEAWEVQTVGDAYRLCREHAIDGR
jgi:acyl carrier protein